MGDESGGPGRPQGVNLVTAPGSCDGVCEVHGAFRAQPARACLRDPARKCSTLDTSRPRGRRKYRRVMWEFGTEGSPCQHVCEGSHAAHRMFRSRNARSEFPGRHARVGLHGKPCSFRGRVTSPGISQRKLRVSCTRRLTWGIPRKRALVVMHRATTRPQVSSD